VKSFNLLLPRRSATIETVRRRPPRCRPSRSDSLHPSPIFFHPGASRAARMRYFDLPPIIEHMLKVSDNISDLNFSIGQAPQVEINGRLEPVQTLGLQKLTPYQ